MNFGEFLEVREFGKVGECCEFSRYVQINLAWILYSFCTKRHLPLFLSNLQYHGFYAIVERFKRGDEP